METVLKGIGVGDGARCEDRSLDPLRSDQSCSRNPFRKKTVLSSSFSVSSLQPLYDVLLGPIADLLQGDELIVVPDGPFCVAPYSASSQSIRIRTIPSLTFLKMIADATEDFHSKTGALLVGARDPWLKEVTDKKGQPILKQLPCAKEEVEMIGELLQTTPLTGKNATKAEVLKRLKSVALVHIAAHGFSLKYRTEITNPQRGRFYIKNVGCCGSSSSSKTSCAELLSQWPGRSEVGGCSGNCKGFSVCWSSVCFGVTVGN